VEGKIFEKMSFEKYVNGRKGEVFPLGQGKRATVFWISNIEQRITNFWQIMVNPAALCLWFAIAQSLLWMEQSTRCAFGFDYIQSGYTQ